MKTVYLQMHLEVNDCVWFGLDEALECFVFKNPKTETFASFPRKEILKPETVELVCDRLLIDVPNEVLIALGKMKS